jgi:hypothetical protein
MISLVEVKQCLQENKEIMEHSSGAIKTRAKNKWQFYKVIEAYIESNPSEIFLASELKRLERRNDLILDGGRKIQNENPGWLKEQEQERRRKYNDDMNVSQLRVQIRALRILNK